MEYPKNWREELADALSSPKADLREIDAEKLDDGSYVVEDVIITVRDGEIVDIKEKTKRLALMLGAEEIDFSE